MLTSFNKLVITVYLYFFALNFACAQNLQGSFGESVFNETFGSGQKIGPPLAPGVTSLKYNKNGCPPDGYYTIVRSVSGCGVGWHKVMSDHTGNVGGMMMLIDGAMQPGQFYRQKIAVCPNVTYRLSAYILNVAKLAYSSPKSHQPNITFSVETASGEQLMQPVTTGIISPTADPVWINYSMDFSTQITTENIVIKMRDNSPGGSFNDFIIDDISVVPVGPPIPVGFNTADGPKTKKLCDGDNVDCDLVSASPGNIETHYQWQELTTAGAWTDIAGADNQSYTKRIVNAAVGNSNYRVAVTTGKLGSTCRVYSDALSIIVNGLPEVKVDAPQAVCEGEPFVMMATGASHYQWSGPHLQAYNQDKIIVEKASVANEGIYAVTGFSEQGCSVITKIIVKVYKKPVAKAGLKQTIFEGQSVALSGATQEAVSSVYWTPTEGLNNPSSLTPIARPKKTTRYTLHAVSANNCTTDTSSVIVRVFNNISVPNAFSPNGDGVNDVWTINGITEYTEALITVFNRYGQKVYTSVGYKVPWDGTVNGAKLAVGTYYYMIDLKHGDPPATGWIAIII